MEGHSLDIRSLMAYGLSAWRQWLTQTDHVLIVKKLHQLDAWNLLSCLVTPVTPCRSLPLFNIWHNPVNPIPSATRCQATSTGGRSNRGLEGKLASNESSADQENVLDTMVTNRLCFRQAYRIWNLNAS